MPRPSMPLRWESGAPPWASGPSWRDVSGQDEFEATDTSGHDVCDDEPVSGQPFDAEPASGHELAGDVPPGTGSGHGFEGEVPPDGGAGSGHGFEGDVPPDGGTGSGHEAEGPGSGQEDWERRSPDGPRRADGGCRESPREEPSRGGTSGQDDGGCCAPE
ncbi:hypothetical protein JYK22_37180 [Nonomuraea sp. RK-328]|nr:hypothetical protein [Nonomuraea sp. RK-328]